MAEEEKTIKEECHKGIPMSDEELEKYYQDFQDIEESIGMVMENGEDL